MNEASGNVEIWSGKDRGDENFPVGVLVSARLRRHVHAFYAFARNADDIADSAELAPEEKIRRLDVMEAVLLGRAAHGSPSAAGLRASLAQTGVSSVHATDLLIAFRRDATKQRYESWEELLDYCRYSAMPVGRHVLELHGESRTTWPASDALCASLQILNHLQDCAKDLAEIDRCYLPLDMMLAEGASLGDLSLPAATPGLQRVIRRLVSACEQLNTLAAPLPRYVRDRRLRVECSVIVNLARRLAERLRRQDPLAARVKLRRGDAVASVLSALRFAA